MIDFTTYKFYDRCILFEVVFVFIIYKFKIQILILLYLFAFNENHLHLPRTMNVIIFFKQINVPTLGERSVGYCIELGHFIQLHRLSCLPKQMYLLCKSSTLNFWNGIEFVIGEICNQQLL